VTKLPSIQALCLCNDGVYWFAPEHRQKELLSDEYLDISNGCEVAKVLEIGKCVLDATVSSYSAGFNGSHESRSLSWSLCDTDKIRVSSPGTRVSSSYWKVRGTSWPGLLFMLSRNPAKRRTQSSFGPVDDLLAFLIMTRVFLSNDFFSNEASLEIELMRD